MGRECKSRHKIFRSDVLNIKRELLNLSLLYHKSEENAFTTAVTMISMLSAIMTRLWPFMKNLNEVSPPSLIAIISLCLLLHCTP